MEPSKNISFLLQALMVFFVVSIFALTWKAGIAISDFLNKENYIIVIIYTSILHCFNKLYGGYRLGVITKGELIYSNGIALIVVNAFTYLLLIAMKVKEINFLHMSIMTIIQISVVIVGCIMNDIIYLKLYPPKEMIAISSIKDTNLEIIRWMNNIKRSYKIVAILKENMPVTMIKKRIDEYKAVLICDINSNLKRELMSYCYDKNICIYMLPNIQDILINTSYDEQICDKPILICKSKGITGKQQFFKRCMDLLIAGIGVILASPIMLVIAICIKLEDRGPIFFKQKRITKGEKEFDILKFRSMIVNAEGDGIARLATKDDCRITKIGKMIRLTRLDELPQLFNILRGEMSVVGPRPERPEILRDYIKECPEMVYRTRVKAGLTGLAQVRGKYNTTPKDKLLFDLLYIERYSFWTDIKLILMTIKIVFMRESTEGIQEGQMNASSKNLETNLDNIIDIYNDKKKQEKSIGYGGYK